MQTEVKRYKFSLLSPKVFLTGVAPWGNWEVVDLASGSSFIVVLNLSKGTLRDSEGKLLKDPELLTALVQASKLAS